MRVAYIRSKAESTGAVSNSSLSILQELQSRGLVTACEEWKFLDIPGDCAGTALLPVRGFLLDNKAESGAFADYIRQSGPPDVLWVDGKKSPLFFRQIFDLCATSFKIVYAKHPRPWNVENLPRYDLCLVDEPFQIRKVKKHAPEIHCHVWDKLIDYQQAFYPLQGAKKYDLCYVATLRKGKNHELLFQAMARLRDRRVSCLCVGGDQKSNAESRERLAPLQQMVRDLGLQVEFAGAVPPVEVNRLINSARVGIMSSVTDAAPRVILEYLAADLPVLVSADMLAGTRYVGPAAGLVRSPEEFHLGIAELLDHPERFSPRAYLLENFSREKVMQKFISILQKVGIYPPQEARQH